MVGFRTCAAALFAWSCHSADAIDLPPPPSPMDDGALRFPETPPGHLVAALGLGASYSCALLVGGAVKCWGNDDYGVLARGRSRVSVSDPSQTAPLEFGGDRRIVQLSAGAHHACVLFEDGRARCWGQNDRGQLGQGNAEHYGDDDGETLDALGDIPLENVISISAGWSNTCALVRAPQQSGGTVHCFGSDQGGAIGDSGAGDFGDDELVSSRRAVPLLEPATAIAAGDGVNCARVQSEDIHCWGDNNFGTLGIGDTPCNVGDEQPCEGIQRDPSMSLVRGLGALFVSELQLEQASACVVDNTGELRCWGRNDQSRAGYPDAIFGKVLSQSPRAVRLGPDVRVVSVGLGTRHGCAVDAEGRVRCWGEAGPQLGYEMDQRDDVAGIGGTKDPADQYAVMDGGGVVQLGDTDGEAGDDPALRVYSGGWHNCAIMVSGAVRCWGANESGQLGYGEFSVIGDIGGPGKTPAETYAQNGRHDVCVVPELSSATSECGR